MKIILLLVFCFGAIFSVQAQKFDGFDEVKQMEKESHEKGIRDANSDFDRKIYAIEIYGRIDDKPLPEEVYLQEKYHVITRVVPGGDLMNPNIAVQAHAKGYNTAMKALLNKLYGKDIFAEANAYARQQKAATHNE